HLPTRHLYPLIYQANFQLSLHCWAQVGGTGGHRWVGTGGWHCWAQVGGTSGHRWVHCWAQVGDLLGTGGRS
ncbi:unnamed protein product, partial [Staurois parvus]